MSILEQINDLVQAADRLERENQRLERELCAGASLRSAAHALVSEFFPSQAWSSDHEGDVSEALFRLQAELRYRLRRMDGEIARFREAVESAECSCLELKDAEVRVHRRDIMTLEVLEHDPRCIKALTQGLDFSDRRHWGEPIENASEYITRELGDNGAAAVKRDIDGVLLAPALGRVGDDDRAKVKALSRRMKAEVTRLLQVLAESDGDEVSVPVCPKCWQERCQCSATDSH